MVWLTKLPKDVLLILFRDWLGDLRSLSLLDQAMTCSALRKQFLATALSDMDLAENECLIETDEIINYLQWLSSRKVRILQLACKLSNIPQIVKLQPNLPSIQTLRIVDEYSRNMTVIGDYKVLFSLFPSIISLDLTDLGTLRDDDALGLSIARSVRCLNLGDVCLSIPSINSLISSFSCQLERLSLSLPVNAAPAVEALKACSLLRSLAIRADLSSSQLLSILSSMPLLEHLAFRRLDKAGSAFVFSVEEMAAMRDSCPRLQRLELLFLAPQALASLNLIFPHASEVSLNGASLMRRDQRVDIFLRGVRKESALLALLTSLCRGSTRAVNIRSCCALSQSSLLVLRGLVGAQVQELQLRLTAEVDDSSLDALLNGCDALRLLSLSGAKVLSNKSLSLIARRCPQLHVLCVESAPKLTDEGFLAICRLPSLRELYLHSCRGLSDGVLRILAQQRSGLEVLSVQGTAITASGLAELLVSAAAPRRHVYVDAHLENPLSRELSARGHAAAIRKINWLPEPQQVLVHE